MPRTIRVKIKFNIMIIILVRLYVGLCLLNANLDTNIEPDLANVILTGQ